MDQKHLSNWNCSTILYSSSAVVGDFAEEIYGPAIHPVWHLYDGAQVGVALCLMDSDLAPDERAHAQHHLHVCASLRPLTIPVVVEGELRGLTAPPRRARTS